MSLYLKYRPKTMQDLVGQKHIKETLENAIKASNLSHAYLFSGPRGTGKTSTARLVARSLTCVSPELTAQADSGSLVDIIEIDAASNRGIDEIRDLRDKIQFAPVMSPAKVYIIDEVHMLTKEAFNALLKTLEEPPSHAYFVLATTEIHKVPDTIISRCQHFHFQLISNNDIVSRLEYICEQEKFIYEKDALVMIAENSGGGLRNAISALEQIVSDHKLTLEDVKVSLGISDSLHIKKLLAYLVSDDKQSALSLIDEMALEGVDFAQLSKELILYTRKEMLAAIFQGESFQALQALLTDMQSLVSQIKSSLIPQLPLELLVMKERAGEKSSLLTKLSVKDLDQENKQEKKPATVEPAKKEELIDQKSDEKVHSFESLKSDWLNLCSKIKDPLIKAAAKASVVESFTDNKITFSVSSDYYIETLSSAQNSGAIKTLIEDYLMQSVEVEFQKKSAPRLSPEKTKEDLEKPSEPKLVDVASEIFSS